MADDADDGPDEDGGMNEDAEILATMAGKGPSTVIATFTKKGVPAATLDEFERELIVGKGTFGKVFKVRHKPTGKVYAMKTIRKDTVLDSENIDSLKLEMEILYNVDHQFIVSMDYVFNDEYRIFFMMDFIEGGELFRHLIQVRRFEHNAAAFMIAQVALALGHLHEKGIIYRDLKPENVLFRKDGYILLADFGLATKIDAEKGELATSFCGTAEYLSPEMITGEGHNFSVDWWTLGILLYEMLVGIPPFFDKSRHVMYRLIRSAKVRFPVKERDKIYVSPAAQDLITKLLIKNKDRRLGSKRGVAEILEHKFFEDLDIKAMLDFKLKNPYVPKEGLFFDPRCLK